MSLVKKIASSPLMWAILISLAITAATYYINPPR